MFDSFCSQLKRLGLNVSWLRFCGLIALLVLVLLAMGWQWWKNIQTVKEIVPVSSEPIQESPETHVASAEPQKLISVHVDGAVAHPQLIQLPETSRINDALEAVGGVLSEADTTDINFAEMLQDGQKIYIPTKMSQTHAEEMPTTSAQISSSSGSKHQSSKLVNINTASEAELQQLNGVGSALARAIVEDRNSHGKFKRVEDLKRVSGIGAKKFEKLKGQICV